MYLNRHDDQSVGHVKSQINDARVFQKSVNKLYEHNKDLIFVVFIVIERPDSLKSPDNCNIFQLTIIYMYHVFKYL